MSQDKKVKKSNEHKSSFVLENDESTLRFLMANIPQIDFAMIIGEKGNMKKFTYSKSFEGVIDFDEQKYIAKLIGLRYRIADFDKIQGGLKMTVNVFNDSCIAVTSRGSKSMIAVITKLTNIENIRQIMSQIKLD